MFTKTIQHNAATLRRGLGLLLVVFIFYGTTVEAAHRHGRIPPRSTTPSKRQRRSEARSDAATVSSASYIRTSIPLLSRFELPTRRVDRGSNRLPRYRGTC